MIKKWVCKWLNLVPMEEYMELKWSFIVQVEDTLRTIDKFQMQRQWEQVKQERRMRRVH